MKRNRLQAYEPGKGTRVVSLVVYQYYHHRIRRSGTLVPKGGDISRYYASHLPE